MACETTSWSSRAIRDRSSATARRLLLAAQALVLGVQLGLPFLPQPQRDPGRPWRADEAEQERHVAEVGLAEAALAEVEQQHHHAETDRAQPRLGAPRVPTEGVERDEEGDHERHRVVVEARLLLGEQLDAEHDQHEGDQRAPTPQRQGDRGQQARRERRGQAALHPRDQLHADADGEGARERGVAVPPGEGAQVHAETVGRSARPRSHPSE
jgi:hypothetical protein